MPDAYRVRRDVSIPRAVSITGEGADQLVETEGVNYPAGSVVRPSEMTPRDRERAENGELGDLLEPISEEDAQSAVPLDEDHGVFVAEHEAERTALESYGHVVVPTEQALELGSTGHRYARDYQAAVRDQGLDRRPVLEHLAQDRPRVPDEVLQGGEHRTGAPYDRGPEGYEQQRAEEEAQQDEEQNQNAEEGQSEGAALRQRPGSTESISAGEQPQEAQQEQAQADQQQQQQSPGQEGQ